MNEPIEIKKAISIDVNALQKIGRATFSETFSSSNTPENMQKYLQEEFSEEKLSEELNTEHAEFYFARYRGDIIGYLKVNFGPAQTELQDDKALEIERIYVSKEFQGKRVGQALYEKALELARARHADYVWLGVWEENTRAIRFYKKNGFIEFDRHIFKLGEDEQTDIMMKLDLL